MGSAQPCSLAVGQADNTWSVAREATRASTGEPRAPPGHCEQRPGARDLPLARRRAGPRQEPCRGNAKKGIRLSYSRKTWYTSLASRSCAENSDASDRSPPAGQPGPFPMLSNDSGAAAMKSTPTGKGFYVLFEDGGIHTYGDAVYHGHGKGGDDAAVDLELTHSGKGYYILSKNGGVHTHGDAVYRGHGKGGDNDAVDLAMTRSGSGYYILSKNGGIHTYGDATYCGHGKGGDNNSVAMAVTRKGNGYYILSKNGGIHTYGDAVYRGHGTVPHIYSRQFTPKTHDALDIVLSPNIEDGYWIVDDRAGIAEYGPRRGTRVDYIVGNSNFYTTRWRDSFFEIEHDKVVAFALQPPHGDAPDISSGGLKNLQKKAQGKNASREESPKTRLATRSDEPVHGYWIMRLWCGKPFPMEWGRAEELKRH